MVLISKRLRELRERAGLSRPKLAQRSKVSLRQIARIENSPTNSYTVRSTTIERLAGALGITPGVLEGTSPMPEETGSARKLPRNPHSLQYDLVRRRYGITQAELFRAAPLMFVLLAERSFLWRRSIAEKISDANVQLGDLGSRNRGFMVGSFCIDQAVADELCSIEKGDLRGTDTYSSEGMDEVGYDHGEGHAFQRYLQHLVKEIDKSGIIDCRDSEGSSSLIDARDFDLLNDDLNAITGEGRDGDQTAANARFALWLGDVRIGDIPDELWQAGTAVRARWIVDHLPEGSDFRKLLILDEEVDDDQAQA